MTGAGKGRSPFRDPLPRDEDNRTSLLILLPKTSIPAIVRLVQLGHRVGATSNSHKAILNLLGKVHESLANHGDDFPIYKVGGDADDPLIEGGQIQHIGSGGAAQVIGDQALVMGGTAVDGG